MKCQAKELIIQLFFGTEGFLFMVVMMGKRDLETCINAVSKTRNTNGKRSRAMVYNLLIDSGTQQSSSKTQCSFSEVGMVMIRWTTFFNTVSYLTIGTRSTELMVHLLNLDIVIRQLFVEAKFTFLEVWILISKDSMIFINLISTRESGPKSRL